MLDTIALWTAGIMFTLMTCVCGFHVRRDEATRDLLRVEKAANRFILFYLGSMALLTMTAAVL